MEQIVATRRTVCRRAGKAAGLFVSSHRPPHGQDAIRPRSTGVACGRGRRRCHGLSSAEERVRCRADDVQLGKIIPQSRAACGSGWKLIGTVVHGRRRPLHAGPVRRQRRSLVRALAELIGGSRAWICLMQTFKLRTGAYIPLRASPSADIPRVPAPSPHTRTVSVHAPRTLRRPLDRLDE